MKLRKPIRGKQRGDGGVGDGNVQITCAEEITVEHPVQTTQTSGKRVEITLIFLDLQVRQPVRVFRCVFRAEGFIFMPFIVAGWWFQKSVARRANCQHLNPSVSTEYEFSRVSEQAKQARQAKHCGLWWQPGVARTREKSSYIRTNPRRLETGTNV